MPPLTSICSQLTHSQDEVAIFENETYSIFIISINITMIFNFKILLVLYRISTSPC